MSEGLDDLCVPPHDDLQLLLLLVNNFATIYLSISLGRVKKCFLIKVGRLVDLWPRLCMLS